MDSRPRVFRPVFDSWLGRVILPAVFLAVLAITALNLLGENRGLMWLILASLPSVGLVAGAYAIPVILGRIVIDREGLAINVDGMRLNLPWREVRAVKIELQNREPYLILGVESGLYVLPVHHFQIQSLWDAILLAAPPEAVRTEAMELFERKDANEGLPPELWMVGVLRIVDHPGLSLAAALGAAGYLLLFVIALVIQQPGAPVYLAFSVLYLLFLTGTGVTELDTDGVTRRTLLGAQRILWDDLTAVEIGPFSLRILLEGVGGRRLVLFGPPMWAGSDSARAVHFLALQISTRRLPRRRSFMVLFRISRNTRIDQE